MQYAELHLHDIYSALDGTSTPEEYMVRAKEIGIDHLAQTNHGTLMGHRHFQRAAKEHGIIPILGEEGYFTTDRFDRTSRAKRDEGDAVYNHITLLAQNGKGLENLQRMNEIGWREGFYEKSRIDLDVLEEYNEGIIVLSGCRGGVLAKALENNKFHYADQMAGEFKRIFGDRYFIEVMSHNPLEMNAGLIQIAEKHGLKHVVTSDCHHARKEDLWVQEAMLILSTSPKPGKDLDFNKSQKMDYLERFNYLYPDRKMTFQDIDIHLNSVEQHLAGLKKHGIGQEAIDNTMVVAGMIDHESYHYHHGLDLLPVPDEGNVDEILETKVFDGLKGMGFDTNPEYVKRAKRELKVIKDKGFSPYFLIALESISWAKSQGIRVGPGRGSGAGSLVCYSLGLTGVDPIKYNLLFERFIDPSRSDWPDLDIDFQDNRREEVKNYTRRRFGDVASILTISYFKDKSAIRAAARVFKVPVGEVNKVMKKVEFMEDYKKSAHAAEFRKKYPEVEALAERLVGRIASVGMHAGGLVVANRPISDIAPVQTAAMPNNPSAGRVSVVAYDMREIEEIGLIKFDYLGLKTLTVVDDCVALIKERTGKEIIMEDLTFDDHDVFKMLSSGRTKGVFQCEATPYTNTIKEMGGVWTFDELVVSNALVRPGAADSSFGENYIKGKNEGEYEYIHADTRWFTEETYGQIIYQEQQMFLCSDLAGMTMEDANKVRRAIGKKKPEELAKWKPAFIEGAAEKIGEKRAEILWHDLEAAANYSFNKSHAVAYSMLSYWTAWLKWNYPLEFMTSVLNSEKDKDKITDYLMEARRLGLRIVLPDVNKSDIRFSIQSDARGEFIRMGLSSIKYISDKVAKKIVDARPFNNYAHLYEVVMTKGSGLSTRVLQSLNAIGGAAFEDNPRSGNERDNFYEYLNLPTFAADLPESVTSQFRPLDEYSEHDAFVCMGMVRAIKTGTGWARAEIVDETGSAGVFTNENNQIEPGQMYVFVVARNRIARYITVSDLVEDKGGTFQEFLEAEAFPDIPDEMAKVVAFNMRITKAGNRMAEVVLSDNQKNLTPALVFPQKFMQAYSNMQEGSVVDVALGETDDGTLFVDRIY
jgi:DNA polymerase-3 subunit alpha